MEESEDAYRPSVALTIPALIGEKFLHGLQLALGNAREDRGIIASEKETNDGL